MKTMTGQGLMIEQSTRAGSLVVVEAGRPVLRREWMEDRFHTQRLFSILAEVWAQPEIQADPPRFFGVGLGPGSYSGMRMALTAVRALALPDDRPIYGVSSAEALAWAEFRRTSAERVVVLGDARRTLCWRICYRRSGDLPVRQGDWQLLAPADCRAGIAGEARWISPDAARLDPWFGPMARESGLDWTAEARPPTADAVGGLIADRLRAGIESDPLEPLYLHPAVTVAPAAGGTATMKGADA